MSLTINIFFPIIAEELGLDETDLLRPEVIIHSENENSSDFILQDPLNSGDNEALLDYDPLNFENSLSCEICGKIFNRIGYSGKHTLVSRLKRHIKYIHEGDGQEFKCEKCDESFKGNN